MKWEQKKKINKKQIVVSLPVSVLWSSNHELELLVAIHLPCNKTRIG